MNDWQRKVQQFHEALGLPVGDYTSPGRSNVELRADLIEEEAEEFDAVCRGETDLDWRASIDALVDLIYVCIGTAVEWGVDLSPVFDEVHRANMAKKGGPISESGKQLKPEGWRSPDIARAIEQSRLNAKEREKERNQ